MRKAQATDRPPPRRSIDRRSSTVVGRRQLVDRATSRAVLAGVLNGIVLLFRSQMKMLKEFRRSPLKANATQNVRCHTVPSNLTVASVDTVRRHCCTDCHPHSRNNIMVLCHIPSSTPNTAQDKHIVLNFPTERSGSDHLFICI